MDGFPPSLPRKTKASSCSRLGSGKLMIYLTHSHTHTHTHTHTLILTQADLWTRGPAGLFFVLSRLLMATSLSPYLGLFWRPSLLQRLAPTQPSALSLPALALPLLPMARGLPSGELASPLCPIRAASGFAQQLRSGAEQGSRVPFSE